MGQFKWDEIQASPATVEALKYGRRLSDKILIAFHHACDKRDISMAEDLLRTLDRLIARSEHTEGHERGKIAETQADASYRLWGLKTQQSPAPDVVNPPPSLPHADIA